MTMTELEAFEAMLAHHRSLADGVDRRVAALSAAVAANSAYEAPMADLVAYLAEEVLRHARAEEQTIYRAAGQRPDLTATVEAMTAEHRRLADSSEKLARAAESQEALVAASTIGSLFASHVDMENRLLLPRLREDGLLAGLFSQMHDLLEGAGQEGPTAGAPSPAEDVLGAVLALLLEAGKALSRGGEGDRACRLVASAWAALRALRPDLAAKATAALHGLVRSGAAEPVRLVARAGAQDEETGHVLDVRDLAPATRHEVIFATYGELRPGTSFVLVNDHDPKPLYYQFAAEHPGEFLWEALETGPQVWRVRIGRLARAGDEPELDVRRLPHSQRHEKIFSAFAGLGPGAGFVLVNDHDPRPLRYQFEAQYAGAYTWDYLEAGPEVWKVRVGRAETSSRHLRATSPTVGTRS